MGAGLIEKIATWVTLGLFPPVPPIMRSDYVQADPEKQREHKMRFAIRQLRWSRFAGVILFAAMVNGFWQIGAVLGLWSGYATAGDVQETQQTVTEFRIEYKRDQLEAELRSIASESVQIKTAIADAEREGRRPADFLTTRLSDLETRKAQVERLIADLPKTSAGPVTR